MQCGIRVGGVSQTKTPQTRTPSRSGGTVTVTIASLAPGASTVVTFRGAVQ
jgi:hypothetical protein